MTRRFQKIELTAFANKKLIRAAKADNGANWLWVCGLLHSQLVESDGFIDDDLLHGIAPGIPDPDAAAATLVETELWVRVDGRDGYQTNDYLVHNRSAQEIRQISSKRAASGRKGAEERAKTLKKRRTPKPAQKAG